MTENGTVDPLGCVCTACGEELEEDEPAIRVGSVRGPARTVCFCCCTPATSLAEASCDACARPLALDPDLKAYCSKRCKKAAANSRAHARRRVEKAARQCPCCGQSLGQRRSDAVFCSASCKQFNYRLAG